MRKATSFLPLTAPLTLIALGCGASGNTTATLQKVSPDRAYSDSPIRVQLIGESFHPPVQVDTNSASAGLAPSRFQVSLDPLRPVAGSGSVAALDSSWKNRGEIDATLPAGLPAGTYSVSLRDATGNTIPSSATFTSLGQDLTPPNIVFLEPSAGDTFGADQPVMVKAHIDDGAGQLGPVERWTDPPPSSSPVACFPDPYGLCQFVLKTEAGPDVVDPIDIIIDASDTLNNHSRASLRVQVARTPSITRIAPPEGPTTGSKSIKVFGDNFVPKLSQIIVDGVSIGGTVADDGSIGAMTTLPHTPGAAPIWVTNGSARSDSLLFTFIPPPILKLIDPPQAVVSGPTVTVHISGNNFRPETQFFWTQATTQGTTSNLFTYVTSPDALPPPPYELLISPTQVELTLPTDRTGTYSISASDPVSGDSVLVDAFTLDPAP